MANRKKQNILDQGQMKKYIVGLAIVLVAATALVFMLRYSRTRFDPNAVRFPVSAGLFHSAAIKADGSLWVWGEGTYGQLGDGSLEDKYEPIKVMDAVASVSARGRHTMAITKDGSLWAWGMNHFGQFGNGTDEDAHTPIRIMNRVAAVYPGGTHTLAITNDGNLWGWGMNDVGQLASGFAPPDSLSPILILDDVVAASAGGSSSFAVKKDGSLWAWGWNYFGQLGDGATEDRLRPKRVLDDVSSVFAGFSHTMAIKKDGSLWAWGSNHYGQLGDGSTEDRLTPVKIMDDVVSVSGSEMFSIAVKKDGSLWVWGTETNGALGGLAGEIPIPDDNIMVFDEAFRDRVNDPDDPLVLDREFFESLEAIDEQIPAPYTTVPLKLMDDVAYASATSFHVLAVKKDGGLWSWGRNDFGQLGDGSLTEGWAQANPEPSFVMQVK
ncbi:MAG: hypothetical protein FWF83_05565 [Clostridiales bacterium]|nr:hypothetical protein [Clostridiales bacterium]